MSSNNSTLGFPIGIAAKRAGMTTHAIRVWERRYGAIQPGRDDAGRRVYTAAEVERLKLLSRVVERGHTIGSIAGLGDPELKALLVPAEEQSLAPSVPLDQESFVNQLRQTILDSAMRYDMDACWRAMGAAVIALDVDTLVYNVCSPLAREVGDRWSDGRMNVAQEHLISAALKSHLLPQVVASAGKNAGPAILFATPENERHELGILFAANIAAARGLRCFYLGCDLPAETIAEAARKIKTEVICLSVVNIPRRERLIDFVNRLLDGISPECEVWLGGFGIKSQDTLSLPRGCYLMEKDAFDRRIALLTDYR